MQIKEILQIGKNKLKSVSETPNLDVEILVGHCLDLNRTELILKNDLELTEKQESKVLNLIERRIKNEPIAYLINKKEFYGFNFYVDKNVLIPRPETEILVDSVLVFVKDSQLAFKKRDCSESDFLIVDVGTGSGCIPISLAQNLEEIDFIAIDISEKALNVARKNLKEFYLDERIKLRQCNLLEDFTSILAMVKENVIITANLPYVEDEAQLLPSVKNYEPHLALFAGKDGLRLYRKLLRQAKEIQPMAIFLEIDPKQVRALKVISRKLFSNYAVEVVKDLAGKDRIFVLTK